MISNQEDDDIIIAVVIVVIIISSSHDHHYITHCHHTFLLFLLTQTVTNPYPCLIYIYTDIVPGVMAVDSIIICIDSIFLIRCFDLKRPRRVQNYPREMVYILLRTPLF